MRAQARRWLLLIAILHAVSPLVLLGVHWAFGIDETVYLSQLNAHVQAGFFSAPRARGSTLLAAPVTLLTSSTGAVRVWVAALSGVALYHAFRPWTALRSDATAPLAAAIFAGLWPVVYYAFEVMPNEWVAFAVLAATGYLLRYLSAGQRRHLVATALALAIAGLFRPSDALYATAALALVCALATSGAGPTRRRRLVAALAVVAGSAAGAVEWVVEAEVRYGGLAARIRAAQAENGGGGVHFAGLAQARALAGPLLCRYGCRAHAAPGFQLWWAGLLILVGVGVGVGVGAGVGVGVRRRRVTPELAAAVVGLCCAAQYLFAVTYAAPRFLTSAYALLAVPAAVGALRLRSLARPGRRRRLATTTLLVCLAAQTVSQAVVVVSDVAPGVRRESQATSDDARRLAEAAVRRPCLVAGRPLDDQTLAYALGCSDAPGTPQALIAALARREPVVWLGSPAQLPRPRAAWRRVALVRRFGTTQVAYVAGADRCSASRTAQCSSDASVIRGRLARPRSADAASTAAISAATPHTT